MNMEDDIIDAIEDFVCKIIDFLAHNAMTQFQIFYIPIVGMYMSIEPFGFVTQSAPGETDC